MNRALLLLLVACGRTSFDEPNDAGARLDAGATDAGVLDAGPSTPEVVFARPTPGCPKPVDESVMVGPASGLVLAPVRFIDECTGAGGDYLVSRDAAGDLFYGGHACYYLTPMLRARSAQSYAVYRFTTLAMAIEPPLTCTTITPVASTRQVDAAAIFFTEAEGRAAIARWSR